MTSGFWQYISEYTVANFCLHPIRCCVIFASPLELALMEKYECLHYFLKLWKLLLQMTGDLLMVIYFRVEAPVAEWLRMLIFSTLNLLSSHRCGFEPSLGHMRQAMFCLRVVRCFFFGDLPFLPHLMIDLAQNEWNNLDRMQNPDKKKIQKYKFSGCFPSLQQS